MKYLLLVLMTISGVQAEGLALGEKNLNCECVSCLSSNKCSNTKLTEERKVIKKTQSKPKIKK